MNRMGLMAIFGYQGSGFLSRLPSNMSPFSRQCKNLVLHFLLGASDFASICNAAAGVIGSVPLAFVSEFSGPLLPQLFVLESGHGWTRLNSLRL
jgi:hypothetical protein